MTVQSVFDQVIRRVQSPRCTIYDALMLVQEVLVARLLLRQSDLLMDDDGVELAFVAGAGSALLPAGVIDLAGRPVLPSGRRLKLLSGREEPVTEPGIPVYYRVQGRRLAVYPAPDSDTSVQVPVFVRPPALATMDDVLPYDGFFDGVFIDVCVLVLQQGVSIAADLGFAAMIQAQVDTLLAARDASAEQRMADTINQEALNG